jgi:hypothetical protein
MEIGVTGNVTGNVSGDCIVKGLADHNISFWMLRQNKRIRSQQQPKLLRAVSCELAVSRTSPDTSLHLCGSGYHVKVVYHLQ